MKHPTDESLALYAGKDLGLWNRVSVAMHVRRCRRCAGHVEEFRGVCDFLESERGEMPDGIQWGALAAEMKANIRLGVAAGQCVAEPAHERIHVPWRTPAIALPVLLVIVLGWILQSLPPPLNPAPPRIEKTETAGVVLEAGPTGIGVEQDGRGFRLTHPQATENVFLSVRGDSVRARYVDADTGQVTISHVYSE